MGQFISALSERKAVKEKWAQWQSRMEEDFAKAEKYSQSSELTTKEKAEVWTTFLSSFSADNPYSTKDDDLRNKAEKRKVYWKEYKETITKLPPKQKYKPPVPKANEIARDGSFIAYDNQTVKDTRTGLMWAAKDNGRHVTWQEAKEYCENYRGGGYTDWRMPTIDELEGLYNKNEPGYRQECYNKAGYEVHITELIRLSCCCPWSSNTRGSLAALFVFNSGLRHWNFQSFAYNFRALPVRTGN